MIFTGQEVLRKTVLKIWSCLASRKSFIFKYKSTWVGKSRFFKGKQLATHSPIYIAVSRKKVLRAIELVSHSGENCLYSSYCFAVVQLGDSASFNEFGYLQYPRSLMRGPRYV